MHLAPVFNEGTELHEFSLKRLYIGFSKSASKRNLYTDIVVLQQKFKDSSLYIAEIVNY